MVTGHDNGTIGFRDVAASRTLENAPDVPKEVETQGVKFGAGGAHFFGFRAVCEGNAFPGR